jgi:hypothetical protein
MSQVYTQSRVTTVTTIRRRYRIPRGCTPKVLTGQSVKPSDTLAVMEIARRHATIDVAAELRIPAQKVPAALVKGEGDTIDEGEVLASRRRLFRRRRVTAPFDGRIIRFLNGQLLLESTRDRVEVESTIPGRVTEVDPESHVYVETTGALVQIAWGHGGLTFGTLRVLDETPSLETNPSPFNIDHRGAIVVIGSPLTEELLKAADAIGVRGLIGPSMHAQLVPVWKEMNYPLGLTQGFGHLAMSERILALLNSYNGREAVLDAGQDADWRERRPEIIIPLTSQQPSGQSTDKPGEVAFATGQMVRILQSPYLGEIGTIAAVQEKPQRLPGGHWLGGAHVNVEPDETIFVPFANLEHLG